MPDHASANAAAPVPVIVCADDYGLSPGVGEAIAGLIAAGRLSATGCMTASPYWPEQAGWLRGLDADVGLHLTLTDQAPAGPMPALAPHGRLPPLKRLLRDAHTGRLAAHAAEVRAEVARQLDRFEDERGAAPDFVDGHQHVHLLPVVREAVLAEIAARYPAGRVWLRDCAEPPQSVLARGVAPAKALFIAWLARGLAARARALGIPVNRGFRGVYDLRPGHDFGRLFRAFLAPARPCALIMVHPARPDAVLAGLDPVVEARHAEHDWLASADCAAALAEAGARPARLRAAPSP